MAQSVRARLFASDLDVLPVKSTSAAGVRYEIRGIQLRPHGRDWGHLELELRTRHERGADGTSRIDGTSQFVFAPTDRLDRMLDRAELPTEARQKLETALQFVSVHPYMPWSAAQVASAMFPGAGWFMYEARIALVDTHPTTNYDDDAADDSANRSSSPLAMGALITERRDDDGERRARIGPGHPIYQTVHDGDRRARLEMLELAIDDVGTPAKYHFACSVRLTGPGEDRRLHAAHCEFTSPSPLLAETPIQPAAPSNIQRLLTGLLREEPDDLIPRVLDALLRPPPPTWRDWVESGALGTVLQPDGYLARIESESLTMTIRSPRQSVEAGLRNGGNVILALELQIEEGDRTRVLGHAATLGWLANDGRDPLESTAFVGRPSVARAAEKYRDKVQSMLAQIAKDWQAGHPTWTRHVFLRADKLLETLASAHHAAAAGTPPSFAAAPRPIAKGDKVTHKTFGTGVVVAVERSGADARLKIEFAAGTKLLASRFVERV
jgi:hypothetical protein